MNFNRLLSSDSKEISTYRVRTVALTLGRMRIGSALRRGFVDDDHYHVGSSGNHCTCLRNTCLCISLSLGLCMHITEMCRSGSIVISFQSATAEELVIP